MRQQGEAGAGDANTPQTADGAGVPLLQVEVSGSKRKRWRGLYDFQQEKVYVKDVGQVRWD